MKAEDLLFLAGADIEKIPHEELVRILSPKFHATRPDPTKRKAQPMTAQTAGKLGGQAKKHKLSLDELDAKLKLKLGI